MQGEALLTKRRTWWRNRIAVPLAFATVLTQLSLVPGAIPSARAGHGGVHIPVTTTADGIGVPGTSLREAVADASAGDVIDVPAGDYLLTEGQILIAKALSIVGAGPAAADVTIQGDAGSDRIFDVAAADVSFTNLLITGGSPNGRSRGGGIQVRALASLTLDGVQVDTNDAYEGGGIYNDGTLFMQNSTVANNIAKQKGGGIENDGFFTAINSTISGNTGKGGGGVATAGTAHLSFVTIWDNLSTNKIGAGTLRNGGTLAVINSIVANNVGSDGDFHDCSGSPDLTNVIVTSSQGCNPNGPTYTFDASAAVGGVADLALPLNDNGGPTETHGLPLGSVAIDASDPGGIAGFNAAECATLPDAGGAGAGGTVTSDQRGIIRDSHCDIGAYEFNVQPPTISATASPTPNGDGWNNTDVTVTITGQPASEVTSIFHDLNATGTDTEVAGSETEVVISTESATNTISYYAENFVGLISSVGTLSGIKIDKTDPTVTASVATVVNGYSPINVVASATSVSDALSGVAGVEYSLNGTDWSVGDSVAVPSTSTAYFRVTDNAGNLASDSVLVQIDSTDPAVSISLNPTTPASGWYKTSVDASVIATDGESGVASTSYGLTGATTDGAANSGPVTISIEGTTYVDASAIDGVGNTGNATQTPVKIDLNVPVVTSTVNGATINQGVAATYAYTCSDALSGLASCVGDFAVGAAIDTTVAGVFFFGVTGTDNAGNANLQTFSYTIADVTAPVVTATYSPTANGVGWHNTDVEVTLDATDNDGGSGVASIEFSTDGGATWSNYAATFTISTEGDTVVGRRATDNAGNPTPPEPLYDSLMIDKTDPTVAANQAIDVDGTPEASVQIELIPSDVLSAANCSPPTEGCSGIAAGTLYYRTTHEDDTEPGPWILYSVPFVVDAVGTTTVDAKVTDVAGNEGVVAVVVEIVIVPLGLTVDLATSTSSVEVGAVTVPIENIQAAILAAQPEGTSTTSTPLTAIPLTAIPLTAIPLTAIPLTAIPLTAIPLTAIPLTAIPLTAIPLTAILLNEISTDTGGSLEPLLAGTDLQDTPLQSINFADLVSVPLTAIDFAASPLTAIPLTAIPLTAIATVIDCNVVNCEDETVTLGDAVDAGALLGGTVGDVLTLDDISVGATPLTAIPLTAIALAGLPLTAIPLTAIGGGGEELTGLDAWCEFLDCAGLGIIADNTDADYPGTGDDWTLITLSIAGIPLTAIPLTAIPLTAIPLSDTPLTAIPLTAIFWESTPLTAIPLTAIVAESAPLTAIPLTAIPLTAIGDVIDCAAFPLLCDGIGTETLGDALAAGAILTSATLGQIGAFLDTISIGDLEALLVLEGYTFADLLYGLIPPSEIPWEEIDIETSRLPDAAEPKQPTFDYIIEFEVQGSRSADVTVTLDPPPGFLFAKDLTDPVLRSYKVLLGDAFPAATPIVDRPVEDADGVLAILMTGLAPGFYRLRLATRAGLTLGFHEASVTAHAETAFVSDGQTADAGPETAAITVVQASINEPGGGSHARAIPLLTEGILELGHVASDIDLDIYKFEIDSGSGFVGQSAKLLLSNLPADYDLVLYGPPLAAPLRGEPVEGFDAVEDFIYDLNPDDEVLDTETLEDIPHFPEQVGLGAEGVVLYAVSSKRGTNNEEIDTGTLVAGTYYVQVSSYNGAFSNSPYMLRRRVNDGVLPQCTVTPFDYGSSVAGTLPGSYPAGLNTIFLYNHARLNKDYAGQDLTDLNNELAAIGTTTWSDLGVIGALVPIDGDTDVYNALADWNTDASTLCDPHEANDVVREVGELIDSIVASLPADTVESIVVIGDDTMVPFARIADGTAISNERTHGVGFAQVNETVGALLAGYYLSDDPYGADHGIAVNNHEFFVPTRAVGRLVETPFEMRQSLANFVTFNGLLDSSTGGVLTGYDFLTDGSNAVKANLEADGFTVTSEINEAWDAADLGTLLSGTFSVGSINAHFDENRALPALGNANGDETDLYEVADLLTIGGLSNRLLFSMGCHSGLSLNDVQIGVPDWAQAFGNGGNSWLANTGFGYGDSAIVGFSEWLNAEFAERVGELPAGQAWVAAKQAVAGALYTIDPYHEKILQEFVYYGLPMFQTAPAAAAAAAAPPGPGAGTSGSSAGIPTPFSALGLLRITIFPPVGSGPTILMDPLVPSLDSTSAALSLIVGSPGGPGILHEVSTADGDYYEVDGETLVARGRPVQPLTGVQVTDPDGIGGLQKIAGGAIITHLAGYQVPAPDPLYATPTVDLGDGMEPATTDWYRPEAGDATFPAGLQRIATYTDDEGQVQQRLLFAPGRYVSPGIQELFTEMEAQVYYRDPSNDDTVPPYIRKSIGWHTDDVVHGGIAYFEVTVDGDGPEGSDDVARVFVLFREEGPVSPTPWLGVDLARVPGTNRWVGGRPRGDFTGENFEFFVQSIDFAANNSTAAAKGEFFLTAEPQDTGVITISLAGTGPTEGWYSSTVGATASIDAGNITGYSLDGGAVQAWDGVAPILITGLGGHFLEVFGTNDNSSVAFIAIDTQGPVVDSSVSPDAVNGYRLPGAVVSVVATDPFGSGVDYIEHCFEVTPNECDSAMWTQNLSGDTADILVNTTTTVRYRAVDIVGNVGGEGPARFVEVDDTPPATTVTPSGTPSNGWYGLDDLVDTDTDGPCTTDSTSCALRLDFAATDSESGVESISYSTDGGTTYTVTPGLTAQLDLFASATVLFYGTDNLGNFPTEAGTFNPDPDSASFQIDAIAPTVTITAAADGAIYSPGEVVLADYSCSDGESGIDSCVGDVANGDTIDTSVVGSYTFTVVGTDLAGNETTVQISYNVRFQFCLLYDPGNEQPATGTVPIKVAVCDSNGNVIKNPQHTLTAVVVIDLDDNIEFIPGPNDTGKANLGFTFRVQGGGKSYIYNLNVDELFLPDGTLTNLPAGHYALGFVVDADFLPDPDPLTGAPVLSNPDEIVYFADLRLKD